MLAEYSLAHLRTDSPEQPSSLATRSGEYPIWMTILAAFRRYSSEYRLNAPLRCFSSFCPFIKLSFQLNLLVDYTVGSGGQKVLTSHPHKNSRNNSHFIIKVCYKTLNGFLWLFSPNPHYYMIIYINCKNPTKFPEIIALFRQNGGFLKIFKKTVLSIKKERFKSGRVTNRKGDNRLNE